nr:helix-turn-helix domain-containing protein [Bacillota bacterium]
MRQGRSIAEVASEVDFRSVSHFCRTFKKFEGTSPGAYSRNS